MSTITNSSSTRGDNVTSASRLLDSVATRLSGIELTEAEKDHLDDQLIGIRGLVVAAPDYRGVL